MIFVCDAVFYADLNLGRKISERTEKVERGVRKLRTCLRKNAVRLAGDICRGMAERENVWGKEKTEDMAGGWQC